MKNTKMKKFLAVVLSAALVAVIIGVCILIFGVETRGESVEDIGNVD